MLSNSNNRHSRMSNGGERNNKPRPRSYCNPSNVSYDSNFSGDRNRGGGDPGDGGDGHMC